LKPDRLAPEVVKLFPVLDYYWEKHAKGLISADAQKNGLDAWRGFYERDTVIADLSIPKQDEFIAHLLKDGRSLGSVSRMISPGRAAINMARDHMLVSAVPKIKDCQSQMEKDEAEPKGRPLSVNEYARLVVEQPSPHMHVFMAIMSNTLCRPGAAMGLTKAQVDFEHDLVNLNPKGRKQNKKYRPIVRLTPYLKKVLLAEEARQIAWAEAHGIEDFQFSHYVIYKRKPVQRVKTSWRNMVEAAGFVVEEEGKETREPITPYSIRHTLSRELRKARVPTEEIGIYLGHRPKGSARTTSIYAPFDPGYLAEAATVVEAFQHRLGAEVAALSDAPQQRSEAA
jgi:integrase